MNPIPDDIDILPVRVPVTRQTTVSGVLTQPTGTCRKNPTVVVMAHGASFSLHDAQLVTLATDLTAAGNVTLRFNFPYRERGADHPDPQEVLEQTWGAVIDWVQTALPNTAPSHVIALGKSMGARVASQMAAAGLLNAEALIFLGYPLHPPGQTDHLRDAHLYHIGQPMLFISGTQDPFCDLDLLQAVLSKITVSAQLEIVEGGDHPLLLPRISTAQRSTLYNHLARTIHTWIATQTVSTKPR